MKKLNSVSGISSLLLVLLAVANVLILFHMKGSLVEAEPPQWMAGIVALIIIAMGIIDLFITYGLIMHFRYFKQASMLSSGVFVLGFFSLFLLAAGVIMLQDIGQEWRAGYNSSGEWNIVFFSQILQAIFGVFGFVQFRRSAKQLTMDAAVPIIEKDEAIFSTVHQVGIFSAVLGFLCMLLLKLIHVPAGYLDGLFVISSIVALFPYGLTALYWLVIKRQVKIIEWYDEKQFMDISQGALITLGITVFLATVMFVLMVLGIIPDNIRLWFPVYLSGTLFVFSLSNHIIANN